MPAASALAKMRLKSTMPVPTGCGPVKVFVNVFHMPQREPAGMLFKQRNGIHACFGYPAKVQFHFHIAGIGIA